MTSLPKDYVARYFQVYPDEVTDYDGTVLWFGKPWPNAELPAPVCHPLAFVHSLPPTTTCAFCLLSLNDEVDSGIAIPGGEGYYFYDLKCWLDLAGIDRR